MASLSTLCAVRSCGYAGCVSFQGHDLCRARFISSCYRCLEAYSQPIDDSEHLKPISGETFMKALWRKSSTRRQRSGSLPRT